MSSFFRILVRLMILVVPLSLVAEWPLPAALLVAAPVAGGVLMLVIRVTRAALKEGWLAEI